MSSVTPPLRQKLRQVATDAMLDAAERCMIRDGYEQATMQQLAAEAGCAAGTFYLYFKSKEEILRAIFARKGRLLHQKVREVYHSEPNPLARVRLGMEALLRQATQEKGSFKLFMEAMPLRHRHFARLLDAETIKDHETTQDLEIQALREAQAMGLIRADLPAELFTAFIQTVRLNMLEYLFVAHPEMGVDQQMETLWKLVAGGIGAKE
jgi:AcrR family transcriptional regulator